MGKTFPRGTVDNVSTFFLGGRRPAVKAALLQNWSRSARLQVLPRHKNLSSSGTHSCYLLKVETSKKCKWKGSFMICVLFFQTADFRYPKILEVHSYYWWFCALEVSSPEDLVFALVLCGTRHQKWTLQDGRISPKGPNIQHPRNHGLIGREK